jgi:tetratricopeptide (TPR) repeat protein
MDEGELLRKASWFAGTAGEPERAVAFARSAVKLADESGDREVAAMTRRRLASALFVVEGREDEARQVIERAWELVADLPAGCEKAWVLAVYASILRGVREPDGARKFAELAVQDARECDEKGIVADALITLGALDEMNNRVEESRERLREAMLLARDDRSPTVELRARHYLGINYYEQGELDEAVRTVEEGVQRAKETGLSWSTYGFELRALKVVSRYARGDWDESEAAAERPGRRVSSTFSARLAALGSHVMVSRGRLAETARLAADLRSEWHRDFQIGAVMSAVGGELALWQGRPEQGVELVREALEWAERVGGQWTLVGIRIGTIGATLYAELAERATRRRDDAGRFVEEGERLVEHARKTAQYGRPRTGRLGPEGRAWLARAEAEGSRLRGASSPSLWRDLRAGRVPVATRGGAAGCRAAGRGGGGAACGRRGGVAAGRPAAAGGDPQAGAPWPGGTRRRPGAARDAGPVHAAGAFGTAAGRTRPDQPAGGRRAVHQREDGERAPVAHHGETGRHPPRGSGGHRLRPRPAGGPEPRPSPRLTFCRCGVLGFSRECGRLRLLGVRR